VQHGGHRRGADDQHEAHDSQRDIEPGRDHEDGGEHGTGDLGDRGERVVQAEDASNGIFPGPPLQQGDERDLEDHAADALHAEQQQRWARGVHHAEQGERRTDEHPGRGDQQPGEARCAQPSSERSDQQPADAHRGSHHAHPVGALPEHVLGDEHVQHVLCAHLEQQRRGEHHQRQQAGAAPHFSATVDHVGPHRRCLFADLLLEAGLVGRARRSVGSAAAQRAGAHQQPGRQQERERVDQEREPGVGGGDHQRTEGRPDEEGELRDHALGRVGRGQVVFRHHVRCGSHRSCAIRHGEHGVHHRQHDHHCDVATRPDDDGHGEHHDEAPDVERHHQPPSVVAIGHHTAERAEHHVREDAQHGRRRHPTRRPRVVDEQHHQRHGVEEVAGHRDRVAAQQPSPTAVAPRSSKAARLVVAHAHRPHPSPRLVIGSCPLVGARTVVPGTVAVSASAQNSARARRNMRVPTTTPHDSGTNQEDDTMSSTNEENTTETEADTEGHAGRKIARIGEAGAEDDDTEGHASRRSGR